MKLIRTQHHSTHIPDKGYRETDEFQPPAPGARIQFVDWPKDPLSQPVEITWLVPNKGGPVQFPPGTVQIHHDALTPPSAVQAALREQDRRMSRRI